MSADRVRYLFAYGSLMSNAVTAVGATERAFMRRQAELVCKASIRGRLYDVGPYPGADLMGHRSERIFGELWHLPRSRAELMDLLDRCHLETLNER